MAARRCRKKKVDDMEELYRQLEEAKEKTRKLKKMSEALDRTHADLEVNLNVLKMRTLSGYKLSPEEFTMEIVGTEIYIVRKK